MGAARVSPPGSLTSRQHLGALAEAVVIVGVAGAEAGALQRHAALLPGRAAVVLQREPAARPSTARPPPPSVLAGCCRAGGGITKPRSPTRGCQTWDAHELSKGWHGGMQVEILRRQLDLGLPAWSTCPGGPQRWRLIPPKVPLVLFAGDWLSAGTGCMVQVISRVWSHLQPSTKAPHCPPLLLLSFLGACAIPISPVAGDQHPCPDTGVAAWGCPAPPGMPAGCGCVTPICPSVKLWRECPSCLLAPCPAAGWGGKSRCLDATSCIKICFGFSGTRGERKEWVAQQCPPAPGEELCRDVIPLGNPSKARGDPAPPWGHVPPRGTAASPCPWPPLPAGLGDS